MVADRSAVLVLSYAVRGSVTNQMGSERVRGTLERAAREADFRVNAGPGGSCHNGESRIDQCRLREHMSQRQP